MIPASSRFLSALRYSHQRRLRITAYQLVNVEGEGETGQLVYEKIMEAKVVSAKLTIDSDADVWRTFRGQFAIPDVEDGEAFSTHNTELHIEVGIELSGTVEWVTLGWVRVEEVSRDSSKGVITITAYDRGMRVTDHSLQTLYVPKDESDVWFTHLQAVQDLVQASYPSGLAPEWVIDPTLDATSEPPQETVLQGQRWPAIKKMADAIGAVVHNDNEGRWVIRPGEVPTDSPVWSVDAGDGGVLVRTQRLYTRKDQFNAIGLTCEPATGLRAFIFLVDNDPASPTYFDGPFGHKNRSERNDTILSGDEATTDEIEAKMTTAARAILDRYKGRSSSLKITSAWNPLLVPMDVIEVHVPLADGTYSVENHVVESLTIDLAKATMDVETRVTREVAEGA